MKKIGSLGALALGAVVVIFAQTTSVLYGSQVDATAATPLVKVDEQLPTLNRIIESPFDSDLSALRNSLIETCRKLQAADAKENKAVLSKEVDIIIADWDRMAKDFADNPPGEYAKDEGWRAYFADARDNFTLMKSRLEEGNFNRSMQFCGMNCALFVKIHQISGRVTITDKMYTLRLNAKLFVSMAMAGNTKGAVKMIAHTDEALEDIKNIPVPAGIDKAVFEANINEFCTNYNTLKRAVSKDSAKELSAKLRDFLDDFGKLYTKYMKLSKPM